MDFAASSEASAVANEPKATDSPFAIIFDFTLPSATPWYALYTVAIPASVAEARCM